jgi:hypothetical protein
MTDNSLLQSLLERVDQLATEVQALKRQQQEKALNSFDAPSDRDVLSLNVGGTHMQVLRGTLTAVPGLLATRFSGEWNKNLVRDADGRFFLDEDPELFGEVVKYLREHNRMLALDCKRLDPPHFDEFPDRQQRFDRMIESFHMSSTFYPMELWRYERLGESVVLPISGDLYDIPQVDHDDNRKVDYYTLRASRSHQRQIESFDVVIKTVEGCSKFIVGWAAWDFDATLLTPENHIPNIAYNVLNPLNSVFNAKLSHSSESSGEIFLPCSHSLCVRSAKFGVEWYVNGEPLKMPWHERFLAGRVADLNSTSLRPFFAVQGPCSFQITKVALEL